MAAPTPGKYDPKPIKNNNFDQKVVQQQQDQKPLSPKKLPKKVDGGKRDARKTQHPEDQKQKDKDPVRVEQPVGNNKRELKKVQKRTEKVIRLDKDKAITHDDSNVRKYNGHEIVARDVK